MGKQRYFIENTMGTKIYDRGSVKMHLKIFYSFCDYKPVYLYRSLDQHEVKVNEIDVIIRDLEENCINKTNQIGTIEFKKCLFQIIKSSPENFNFNFENYLVYYKDVLEQPEEPFVRDGSILSILFENGRKYISGKICDNLSLSSVIHDKQEMTTLTLELRLNFRFLYQKTKTLKKPNKNNDINFFTCDVKNIKHTNFSDLFVNSYDKKVENHLIDAEPENYFLKSDNVDTGSSDKMSKTKKRKQNELHSNVSDCLFSIIDSSPNESIFLEKKISTSDSIERDGCEFISSDSNTVYNENKKKRFSVNRDENLKEHNDSDQYKIQTFKNNNLRCINKECNFVLMNKNDCFLGLYQKDHDELIFKNRKATKDILCYNCFFYLYSKGFNRFFDSENHLENQNENIIHLNSKKLKVNTSDTSLDKIYDHKHTSTLKNEIKDHEFHRQKISKERIFDSTHINNPKKNLFCSFNDYAQNDKSFVINSDNSDVRNINYKSIMRVINSYNGKDKENQTSKYDDNNNF